MAALIIPLAEATGGGARRSDEPGGTPTAPPLAGSLFWRGRLVVGVVLCAITAIGLVRTAGDAVAWATGDVPAPPPGATVHVVEPGESYWSIARTLEPTGDVRPLVDRLVELNGGAELRAGDTVVLRW